LRFEDSAQAKRSIRSKLPISAFGTKPTNRAGHSTPLRRSVIDFGSNDMVPRVAAPKAHQRL
jgi:hypothetical protein